MAEGKDIACYSGKAPPEAKRLPFAETSWAMGRERPQKLLVAPR